MSESSENHMVAVVRNFIASEVGFDGGSGMTDQAERLAGLIGAVLTGASERSTMLHDDDCDLLWRSWLAKQFPMPPRDAHEYWAAVCICGMSEQERTGHYPEHHSWCDVPSPMDDEDQP